MKKQILFVDDEPNFLDGIRRMLRGQRKLWEMTFVHSVDEALEKTAGNEFDAIVSDINMPLKSGFDLLGALRAEEQTETIPIIILTGNAESDLKRKALDMGATDLLNKPVNAEDLRARLQSVLRLKSYQDELKAQNEILEQRVRERTRDLERSRRDIIWRLAKAGEFRDEDTGEHVIRVACCSRILARAAGLKEDEVEIIFLTSPLHDIGKIGISDGILLKEGSLTAEERKVMEGHCEIGASVLLHAPKGMEAFVDIEQAEDAGALFGDSDPLREMAATIAMTHHEKWDGTGYPKGLRGEEIPMAGQIVSISDVFDALRSQRPYKKEFSKIMAVEIMKKMRGVHFSPDLFDRFESVVDDFEAVRQRHAE